jgi:hypothetical protein
VSCLLGGGDEEEAFAWANWGRSTQVPPSLHSTLGPATWPPFIIAVEPLSTVVGGSRPPIYPWLVVPP